MQALVGGRQRSFQTGVRHPAGYWERQHRPCRTPIAAPPNVALVPPFTVLQEPSRLQRATIDCTNRQEQAMTKKVVMATLADVPVSEMLPQGTAGQGDIKTYPLVARESDALHLYYEFMQPGAVLQFNAAASDACGHVL